MATRNRVALARSVELLYGISARRFEQPVAQCVTLWLGQHQRLINQRRQHVEHVEFVEIISATPNCNRSLKREAVDEDSQTPEERALALVEQIVAPVDE